MLDVQTAIEIASTHASKDITRESIRPVVVEPNRVWATDGHRAIVLNVEVTPEQCGHYVDGQKLVTPVNAPNIDYVLPKKEPPISLTMDQDQLAKLKSLAWMLDRRTQVRLTFRAFSLVHENGFVVCELARSTAKRNEEVRLNISDMPIARKHAFGINLAYLLDAIEGVHINGDIELRQEAALDPIVIKGSRGFAIVMPTRM